MHRRNCVAARVERLVTRHVVRLSGALHRNLPIGVGSPAPAGVYSGRTFVIRKVFSARWFLPSDPWVFIQDAEVQLQRTTVHTKTLSRIRASAFQVQDGRCSYCGAAMWLAEAEQFAARYSLTSKQSQHFRCTSEHLTAQCVGGSNAASNIVAACLHCNNYRHRPKKALDPGRYRRSVAAAVAAGHWPDRWAHQTGPIEAGFSRHS